MSQTIEQLINKLKLLDVEEKQVKEIKNDLLMKIKEMDQQLDQISYKRSLTLKELELIYSSEHSSDTEFQSLCSDYSVYPKSSDIDSDDYPHKRKSRSDSSSDVETKKSKNMSSNINSVEDINNFDQKMVNKCIDEMATKVMQEITGTNMKLKDELEKLSVDPEFESLVKDVEKESPNIKMSCFTQTTPLLTTLCRSYSTDGNFKENTSPSSTRVRRSFSNRFKFDQQNQNMSTTNRQSSHKSFNNNNNVISSNNISPSNVLKGRKLLSNLLSENQIIDEKKEKYFTEKVEITSKDFKQNMCFWEKKTTESLLNNKIGIKIVSA